ncbi:MAG: hypothetical protein ACUZ77_11555 [Candidatus Brocadiales bacterium]
MTTEIIFLVEESEEGGYIARALGYSIYKMNQQRKQWLSGAHYVYVKLDVGF